MQRRCDACPLGGRGQVSQCMTGTCRGCPQLYCTEKFPQGITHGLTHPGGGGGRGVSWGAPAQQPGSLTAALSGGRSGAHSASAYGSGAGSGADNFMFFYSPPGGGVPTGHPDAHGNPGHSSTWTPVRGGWYQNPPGVTVAPTHDHGAHPQMSHDHENYAFNFGRPHGYTQGHQHLEWNSDSSRAQGPLTYTPHPAHGMNFPGHGGHYTGHHGGHGGHWGGGGGGAYYNH